MIMILHVDVTAAGGIIKLIAHRAIRHPLNQPAKGRPNPLNPLNPLNPGHRVAPLRYHHPQRRRRCRPLSEANTTLLHNPRRSRAPLL